MSDNLDTPTVPAGFNLLDTATFKRGHPHALYDRMRAAGGVLRNPGSAKQPAFWVLTNYADINTVSRDAAKQFTSTKGFRISTDNRASMDPEIGRILSRFMLSMDRPEHEKYRALVSSHFLPAGIRALEPRVKDAITDVLDGLKGRTDVDFVADVAAAVPIKTVCALLGVPREDEERVIDLTNSVFGTDDPEFAPSLEEANRRYLEVLDYAGWLLEQRRKEPREDLVTLFAHGRIDDQPLSETEQRSFFSNMLAAGNETTRSSLAGAAWALYRNPTERERVVRDLALLENAVYELLRYVSPVYQMARTATVDLELGGQKIAAGERVALLYGAANRDAEVFADPHRLDVGRDNAQRHLTFGIGIHHCLGSRLGAMQMRVILGEFLARYPRFEVTSPPAYLASNFVAAVKTMPVRLAA